MMTGFNSLVSVKDSITCDYPTDAISDCLNTDRVLRSVVTSFFVVAAIA